MDSVSIFGTIFDRQKITKHIQVTKKFDIVGFYSNDWPVRDAMKMRLKYMSDSGKRRLQKVKVANLKNVRSFSISIKIMSSCR